MLEFDMGIIIQASDQFSEKSFAAQERKARAKASGEDCPSILIVDDEARLADTMTEIFNLSGFCAFTAYEGDQALKLAQEIQPDYLLTDVLMPGLNGVELAIAVRKFRPGRILCSSPGRPEPSIYLKMRAAQDIPSMCWKSRCIRSGSSNTSGYGPQIGEGFEGVRLQSRRNRLKNQRVSRL